MNGCPRVAHRYSLREAFSINYSRVGKRGIKGGNEIERIDWGLLACCVFLEFHREPQNSRDEIDFVDLPSFF